MTDQSIRKGTFLSWGLCPQTPGIYRLWARMVVLVWTTMEALERRIGLRRNATRAPTQAPEWRGRLRPPRIANQTCRSETYCGQKMVLTKGSTFNVALGTECVRKDPARKVPRLLAAQVADAEQNVPPHSRRVTRHHGGNRAAPRTLLRYHPLLLDQPASPLRPRSCARCLGIADRLRGQAAPSGIEGCVPRIGNNSWMACDSFCPHSDLPTDAALPQAHEPRLFYV
jgi:hypothetical protein